MTDAGHGSAAGEEPIRVSVCIPAYNEEAVIADAVAEAAEVLCDLPGRHEILVCDDGSGDRTWDILTALAEEQPMLRPIRHERNQGFVAATRTLTEAARGEYIAQYPADREWRMSDIPRLLEAMEQGGCDIVIGVRRHKQYGLWRKFVSGAFNLTVAVLWGKHFGDIGSIKLARARLWKLIPLGSSSAAGQAERLLIAHRSGARIGSIPVDHTARETGESRYASPLEAVRAFFDLVKFRLSRRGRARLPEGWRSAPSTGSEAAEG